VQRIFVGQNFHVCSPHREDIVSRPERQRFSDGFGGEIVAEGTPEQVAKAPRSYTGRYLAPLLKPRKAAKVAAVARLRAIS
jgi:hypothetical protein